jgi:hypothetical protein
VRRRAVLLLPASTSTGFQLAPHLENAANDHAFGEHVLRASSGTAVTFIMRPTMTPLGEHVEVVASDFFFLFPPDLCGVDGKTPDQSLQNPLNRSERSSVYRTVCMMLR